VQRLKRYGNKDGAWNAIRFSHQSETIISDVQNTAEKYSTTGILRNTGSSLKRKKDTPAIFVGSCLCHRITWSGSVPIHVEERMKQSLK